MIERVTVYCASSDKIASKYFEGATEIGRMMDRCIEEQFMGEIHRGLWSVISKPEELMSTIENAPNWEAGSIHFAKA